MTVKSGKKNFITPGKGSKYEPKRGYRGVHGGFRRQDTPIPIAFSLEGQGHSKSRRHARNSRYLAHLHQPTTTMPNRQRTQDSKTPSDSANSAPLHAKARRNAFELDGIPAVHPPKFKGLTNPPAGFTTSMTGQPIPLGYHTVSRDNPPVSRQLARASCDA